MVLAQAEGSGGSPLSMMPAIVGIVILFYFMLIRPERRKQQTMRQMIEEMKKNDKVVTVGGMYGVVTGVSREANEVTLRIDDNNNTKIRVTLDSIARIMPSDAAAEK